MRHLVSGLTAALTALLVGTLIAGAADSARAADAAKQAQAAEAITADTSGDQTLADANAYRAQLQDAVTRLNTAYAELKARDAAYRELLATSQQNVDRLQSANAQLQQQLQQVAAQLQQAQTLVAQAQRLTTTRRVEHDD